MANEIKKPIAISSEKLEIFFRESPLVAADVCRLLIAHNVLTSLNRMYVGLLDKQQSDQKELNEGDRLIHIFLRLVC